MAAFALPPVAIKSSMIKTFSSFCIPFAEIHRVSTPYSFS
jgi:hypothetical protein